MTPIKLTGARSFSGYCSIEWAQSSDLYGFSVTGDTFLTVANGSIGTTGVGFTGLACVTDFVVIPAPILDSNDSALNADRFCGNGFPTVISELINLTDVSDVMLCQNVCFF